MDNIKYTQAKEAILKTLNALEGILNEESPTGLNQGVTCENLDCLIEKLEEISTSLEKYSK